jgi:ferredoxin
MKYTVDSALCCGAGRCYVVAPEVYRKADDGTNADAGHTVEVPSDLEQAARDGASSCPESAIMLMEVRESV